MIYHITTIQDWESQNRNSTYSHESLKSEGFIHCSEESQIAGVLERYYVGKKDLIKLSIDPSLLNQELRYEMAAIGEEFPHVFGPINKSAILSVTKV